MNRIAPRTPSKPKILSDQDVSRNIFHLSIDYAVAVMPIDWITISEFFKK
jgi:hypothetical protein